jgi:hypothetical protein
MSRQVVGTQETEGLRSEMLSGATKDFGRIFKRFL